MPEVKTMPSEFDRLEASLKKHITAEIERLLGAVPEKAIDIKAASSMLGFHPQTIYKLVRNREIPFHKKGRGIYFLPSELHQYMKRS